MGTPRHAFVVAALTAVLLLGLGSEARAGAELISFGPNGLRHGASTTLHAKAVTAAAYDPEQELVWFVSGGTLHVIDLRDAKRKPVAIAKKMPEGPFAVSGISSASYATDYAGYYPIIDLGKKLKVKSGAGAYGDIWEDQDKVAKKAIKKIKVVGAAWLKKQQKRAKRAGNAPAADNQWGTTVVLPEGVGECDDTSLSCGDSQQFGATPFKLVVVESGCGDACHASCVLFDPKTKRWASPTTTGDWTKTLTADLPTGACWDYGFRGDGAYFNAGASCTAGNKVTCTEDEAWLHVGYADADLALTPVTAAATTSTNVDMKAALAEIAAMKDRVCACKDKACGDKVLGEMEAMGNKYAHLTPTKAEEQQITDIATALMTCYTALK